MLKNKLKNNTRQRRLKNTKNNEKLKRFEAAKDIPLPRDKRLLNFIAAKRKGMVVSTLIHCAKYRIFT